MCIAELVVFYCTRPCVDDVQVHAERHSLYLGWPSVPFVVNSSRLAYAFMSFVGGSSLAVRVCSCRFVALGWSLDVEAQTRHRNWCRCDTGVVPPYFTLPWQTESEQGAMHHGAIPNKRVKPWPSTRAGFPASRRLRLLRGWTPRRPIGWPAVWMLDSKKGHG